MIHYQMMRSILLLDLKNCTEGRSWRFPIDSKEYSLSARFEVEIRVRNPVNKEYEIRICDLSEYRTPGFMVVSADVAGNAPSFGQFIAAVEILMKALLKE